MNYPFILKFSSITNLSDARYAVCAWADYVGFCFEPSKQEYIEPIKAKEIAGWINGSLIVGEFGHQPIEWIKDFVAEIPCGAIQVPANYKDTQILDFNLPIILEFTNEMTNDVMEINNLIKAFICYNIDTAKVLNQKYNLPVLVELSNYNHLIQYNHQIGISLKGEFETIPGTRNHDKWNNLLEDFN